MGPPAIGRAALARMVDHTLLAPTATAADATALCREAGELGVAAVCVSPSRLPLPAGAVPDDLAVAAVVGFPSGAHTAAAKAHEAEGAVRAGASEIDMVIDLGAARAGDWGIVEADIRMVRLVLQGRALLKVIIESAALDTVALDAVERACIAARAAGADFVKTSTGFHPAGGATVEAVARMRATVGDDMGVKASGGIRDWATAVAMVDAGASRLGCSATRAVLDGAPN